ncbi:MAG: DUF4426 domain-containing protein [Pseudomonadota bacterium]|nr:DUF4426 domain-containing protein [Pseudomonadota bacterium]MDQ3160797.1 DUF4426 domain-containing protein [Pseudomonadota bacterium]
MNRSHCSGLLAVAMSLLGLAGCGGNDPPAPAQPMQVNASATSTVDGLTLQASTMDVANVNETVAKRYAIERGASGLMLMVTVRDASGNGVEPADLSLEATAGALVDAPAPVPLLPITTNGMTDYIGVFRASPPTTVRFRITAIRNGARAELSTTAELYPR